jgi:hypothetical protein
VAIAPQPDVLQNLSDQPGFRGRGLLARFLYALPPSPLGSRLLQSNPVPALVARRVSTTLRHLALEFSDFLPLSFGRVEVAY